MIVERVRGVEPWRACLKLAGLPRCIFLDSAAVDPVRGRYSYIAASPFETITVEGGSVRVERPASEALHEDCVQTVLDLTADPFRVVADRLAPHEAAETAGLPPFQGGAAGFIGYGLSRAVEKIPAPRWDELAVPDLRLGLYDWVLAFDLVQGDAWIVSHGYPGSGASREARAARRVREVLEVLGGRDAAPQSLEGPARMLRDLAPEHPVAGREGLLSNFSREGYVQAVERAIEYIRAGDIFQANLSQRLIYPLRRPPLEVYGRLRETNPAPFAAYLDGGDFAIASSSPEQFLTLSGREVVTRPIKGTRPREYTPEADSYGGEALRESEKDRAENVMIVDLLRNDLSRVSKPHSVRVPRLFEVERHPTVHHLVSEVRSELKEGLGATDLLRSTFPGGSVTGCPKVRAMEIIAELEPTARGPYCGCMGWIAFHGGMSLNILIRTVTAARGWLQLPAGGGIVALSRPEVEYQETLHKAEGMVRALAD